MVLAGQLRRFCLGPACVVGARSGESTVAGTRLRGQRGALPAAHASVRARGCALRACPVCIAARGGAGGMLRRLTAQFGWRPRLRARSRPARRVQQQWGRAPRAASCSAPGSARQALRTPPVFGYQGRPSCCTLVPRMWPAFPWGSLCHAAAGGPPALAGHSSARCIQLLNRSLAGAHPPLACPSLRSSNHDRPQGRDQEC